VPCALASTNVNPTSHDTCSESRLGFRGCHWARYAKIYQTKTPKIEQLLASKKMFQFFFLTSRTGHLNTNACVARRLQLQPTGK